MGKTRKPSSLAGIEGNETAKKRAWMVLSVLSGHVGVSEAVREEKISPSRYYQLETKALKGMVHALSPEEGQARGTMQQRLERAQRKLAKLEEEQARQRQLLRMARKMWGTSSLGTQFQGTPSRGTMSRRAQRQEIVPPGAAPLGALPGNSGDKRTMAMAMPEKTPMVVSTVPPLETLPAPSQTRQGQERKED